MANIESRKDARKNNSKKHERDRVEWTAAKKVARPKQTWDAATRSWVEGKV
jgi:hypothetical protein